MDDNTPVGQDQVGNTRTTVLQENSRAVRAGKRTYFFDVKDTSAGDKYLVITESRYTRQGDNTRERNSIWVFPEDIKEFVEALTEMAKKVKGRNRDLEPEQK